MYSYAYNLYIAKDFASGSTDPGPPSEGAWPG